MHITIDSITKGCEKFLAQDRMWKAFVKTCGLKKKPVVQERPETVEEVVELVQATDEDGVKPEIEIEGNRMFITKGGGTVVRCTRCMGITCWVGGNGAGAWAGVNYPCTCEDW